MRKTHTNADMSHENRLSYKISIFFKSLRDNGVLPTVRKIAQRLYYKIKRVDFETQNIYDLTRKGEYKEHGTALVSTSLDFLSQLLGDLERTIDKPLNRTLFVDFGSGKGAGIIHAKKLGFKRAIGVEFAKELHEIAQKNIKALGLDDVESIYEDATEYNLPKETTLIYFFNPFDEVVMQKVFDNIMKQKDSFENDVYVIYGNASCTVWRDNCELLDKITYISGATAEFYKL